MIPSIQSWSYKAARALVQACAVYYLTAFIYIAVSRDGYPFSLEWLEGGSYVQVNRILSGQALYARPGIEYVAMIYPPLYYYVSAAVSRLIGLGFLPLRLVSFASALGSMGLISLICRQERAAAVPAFVAGALFAATYGLSGSWFDIARVDMLSLFLVLLAIWLLRHGSLKAQAGAGVAFALAALTKQSHLITLVCLCIYLAAFERRKLPVVVLPFVAVYAAAYLLLDRLYSGWYSFFVFKLALGSGEFISFAPGDSLRTAVSFWWRSILAALPVAILFIAGFMVLILRRRDGARALYFYTACAVGMIGTSWSVIQVGGYKNDLLPAYAVIAILFGLSAQELCYAPSRGLTARSALLAGCAVQFLILHYPIASQIPTDADRLAGQALLDEVRAQPGAVYIPFHSELALMAGKAPFTSWSPMYQLEGNFGGGDVREAARVKTQFANAMARHDFSLIVLDQTPNWIWGHPENFYSPRDEPIFSRPDVFWPVAGWQIRPTIAMVPIGK